MKIRKTKTNIKRIERWKKTVAFILFQAAFIAVFVIFGIVQTACATEDNTTEMTSAVEDYSYYKLRWSNFRYKIFVEGKAYRTTSYFVTVNHEEFRQFLSGSPKVTLRFDRRGNLVRMQSDGVEYVSLDQYNHEQSMRRIISIVLFIPAEVFVCTVYVLYMLYNRTSNDRKWLGFPKRPRNKSI